MLSYFIRARHLGPHDKVDPNSRDIQVRGEPGIDPVFRFMWKHYGCTWQYSSVNRMPSDCKNIEDLLEHVVKIVLEEPFWRYSRSEVRDYYLALEEIESFTQKISAKKIQRAWHRAISNPAFALCKRRLTKEFMELSSVM